MKAIQIKQTGGPEVLEYVDLPTPEPKPNEAVVKIAASGVNFIDVYQREGRYKLPLPFIAGQEGAGVVTAVGAEVKSLKSGDRVAFCGVQGSYAEYAAVPGYRWKPSGRWADDGRGLGCADGRLGRRHTSGWRWCSCS